MVSLLSTQSSPGSEHRPAALKQLVPWHLLEVNMQNRGLGGLLYIVVPQADAPERGSTKTFSLPVPVLGTGVRGGPGVQDALGCRRISMGGTHPAGGQP